jgi:hypothetical protein
VLKVCFAVGRDLRNKGLAEVARQRVALPASPLVVSNMD